MTLVQRKGCTHESCETHSLCCYRRFDFYWSCSRLKGPYIKKKKDHTLFLISITLSAFQRSSTVQFCISLFFLLNDSVMKPCDLTVQKWQKHTWSLSEKIPRGGTLSCTSCLPHSRQEPALMRIAFINNLRKWITLIDSETYRLYSSAIIETRIKWIMSMEFALFLFN